MKLVSILVALLLATTLFFEMVGVGHIKTEYRRMLEGEYLVVSEPRASRSFGVFANGDFGFRITLSGKWSGYMLLFSRCADESCAKGTEIKNWYLGERRIISIAPSEKGMYYFWVKDLSTGDVVRIEEEVFEDGKTSFEFANGYSMSIVVTQS